MKCQVCKQNEYVYGMQYVGSDRATFTRPGFHYRGFHTLKICTACIERYEAGDRLEFRYRGKTLYNQIDHGGYNVSQPLENEKVGSDG